MEKELSVKRLYREVRYCPNRPNRWGITNRSSIGYRIGHKTYSLYHLEKLLLALKATKIPTAKYSVGSKGELVITSSGYKFEYKLKPLVRSQKKVMK